MARPYSDGEKLLLTKTNALNVDPNVRRSVSSDIGQEDQGPGFAQRVLYQGTGAPPPAPASECSSAGRRQTRPQCAPVGGYRRAAASA